jgi:transposase
MEGTSLLSLPEGMQISQIQATENGFVITIVTTHPTSCCPLCSERSSSIQGHYRRTLRDAPCAGRQVQLLLTVRKFYCRNPLCERHPCLPSVSQPLWSPGPGQRFGIASRSPPLDWQRVAKEELD